MGIPPPPRGPSLETERLQHCCSSYHCNKLSLSSYHWLPDVSGVQFKILFLPYKAPNGLSPLYIVKRLTLKNTVDTVNSSQSNRLLLSVPAANTVTYGQRSSVCLCCQHCYLWSTFFCLSLLSTLLPMVNVLLSVSAVNTVTYGQRSSVCPCCQHCYLWSTFCCLSQLSTLLPMLNYLSPLRQPSNGTR